MPDDPGVNAAGVDAGTECVKAVVVNAEGRVLGRAVVPTRGYFQACVYEALAAALDDAQRTEADLVGIGATGFAMDCVGGATATATEAACDALGAFHLVGEPMTLVNIGGRDPHVIQVEAHGRRGEARNVRRCASGVGSFLMFTARHLDVIPTRLQELASAAERPRSQQLLLGLSATGIWSGSARPLVRDRAQHALHRRTHRRDRQFEDPVYVCGGSWVFPGRGARTRGAVRQDGRAFRPIFTGARAALGCARTASRAVCVGATP
jgi:hypothetical protein